MNTYCTISILKRVNKPLQSIQSLGFAMPFQPSMWDDKSTQCALDITTHNIESKLKNSYSDEFSQYMLQRLQQLFTTLNFTTHRKSIATIISADAVKVMYLNFPVRLFISTNKFISVLKLLVGIKQEAGFYLLINSKTNRCIYE